MALGKIKADTLEHSTVGSLDTKFVVKGSAKAICNMTPSGGSNAASSLNISSVTDGGVGVNTAALSNAFSAAKAAVPTGICHDESNNRIVSYDDTSASSLASRTTKCSDGSTSDSFDYTLVAHGDLA